MSISFKIILIIVSVLRIPLSILPIIFQGLHPFLRTRLAFERKNFLDPLARPFKADGLKGDVCFEVSSEGELEQVRTLMNHFLKVDKKKIEILYSSPSVEKKCEAIARENPDQVRVYRLPLLSFWPVSFLYFQNFWGWVSSPVIVFCRYDFFPELLLMRLMGKKFVLLSAATKKWSWYKDEAMRSFDFIVAATPHEEKVLKNKFPHIEIISCDLRIPRIAERRRGVTMDFFREHQLENYVLELRKKAATQKVVFGSFWPSDLPLLRDPELVEAVRKKDLHLCLVPHKLDRDHLSAVKQALVDHFGPDLVGLFSESGYAPVMLLDKSGILCELYSEFDVSYVGGGYERSIHSVLEPFISGSKVLTGPKIARSTEYDLVAEVAPNEIQVLKNPESFYTSLREMQKVAADQKIREELNKSSLENFSVITLKLTSK